MDSEREDSRNVVTFGVIVPRTMSATRSHAEPRVERDGVRNLMTLRGIFLGQGMTIRVSIIVHLETPLILSSVRGEVEKRSSRHGRGAVTRIIAVSLDVVAD